jgi:hypothetical protein
MHGRAVLALLMFDVGAGPGLQDEDGHHRAGANFEFVDQQAGRVCPPNTASQGKRSSAFSLGAAQPLLGGLKNEIHRAVGCSMLGQAEFQRRERDPAAVVGPGKTNPAMRAVAGGPSSAAPSRHSSPKIRQRNL